MNQALSAYRVFFETPQDPETINHLIKSLYSIPMVSGVAISLPFNTAKFMTTIKSLAQITSYLVGSGVKIVTIQQKFISWQ